MSDRQPDYPPRGMYGLVWTDLEGNPLECRLHTFDRNEAMREAEAANRRRMGAHDDVATVFYGRRCVASPGNGLPDVTRPDHG